MALMNPLVTDFQTVQEKVDCLKSDAKAFYFQVLLSQYACPDCEAPLTMTGISECECENGHRFDPTLQFQRSSCCRARLARRTYHFVCSKCGQITLSRFLFDERLFDADYFREHMREYRSRARARKEELRRLLAESRSNAWLLSEELSLERIPDFTLALDQFIGSTSYFHDPLPLESDESFDMEAYRAHILGDLGWSALLFSDIGRLADHPRRDAVWRFITLLFMEQDRVVNLSQSGDDILIERVWHETDRKRQGVLG